MMQSYQPLDPRDPRYNDATEPLYVEETPPPAPHYVEETPHSPAQRPVAVVRRTHPDEAYAPSWRGWHAAQIVYTIAGIIEVLILIRAVLELFAANPGAAFTNLIYTITDPLVAPFQGVFPTPQSHGSVLDLAAILAIIVYALLAWIIARLLELAERRR